MPSYGAHGMPEAVKLYQALTQHDQIIYQLLARYLCRCNTKFATKVMPWGQPCHCHWLISEPACYTNKILLLKQSSSDMCSAIPTALLCEWVGAGHSSEGVSTQGVIKGFKKLGRADWGWKDKILGPRQLISSKRRLIWGLKEPW